MTSPIKADRIINAIKTIDVLNVVNTWNKLLNDKEIISVRSKPATTPKIVLFGLIFGKILFFPNNEPKIYEKISKQVIIRIKYKNIILFFS